MAKSLNKQCCPSCGRSLNEREVVLYDGMVQSLARIYKWCVDNNKWKGIKSREIRHLFGPNEVDRFRDWRYFTPLMVGGEHGEYIFDKQLISNFITGVTKVPTRILKNPLTKEIHYFDLKKSHEIADIREFMNENDFLVYYDKTSEKNVVSHIESASYRKLFQTIKKGSNGELSCTCEGFKFRKTCRHLIEYNKTLTASLF